MLIRNPSRRRAASLLARTGVVFSVVGLGISAWNMSFGGVTGAAAATDAGAAQVVFPADAGPDAGQPMASGGSATAFTLSLPAGAACSKDSSNGDYRVQSYMVPETVSPNDLQFDSAGPTPAGYAGALADFKMPLWSTTGSSFVDASTAAADAPGGAGSGREHPLTVVRRVRDGRHPGGHLQRRHRLHRPRPGDREVLERAPELHRRRERPARRGDLGRRGGFGHHDDHDR